MDIPALPFVDLNFGKTTDGYCDIIEIEFKEKAIIEDTIACLGEIWGNLMRKMNVNSVADLKVGKLQIALEVVEGQGSLCLVSKDLAALAGMGVEVVCNLYAWPCDLQ